MRAIFLILGVACTTAAGCSDTTSPAQDLAIAAPDLSRAADLSVAPDLTTGTCAQAVACLGQCTAQNINTCAPACIAKLSSTAQPYFQAVEQCAQPACYATDGGAPPCSDPSSTACQSCLAANCAAQLQTCMQH